MRTIMAARSPHDSSFSFSRRYFNWPRNKLTLDTHHHDHHHYHEYDQQQPPAADYFDHQELLTFNNSSFYDFSSCTIDTTDADRLFSSNNVKNKNKNKNKKQHAAALSNLIKSAFNKTTKHISSTSSGTTKMIGTLFGYRRGHVHLAFQEDPKQPPAFLIELATPTSVLVREMASGLVRIALECEKIKPLSTTKTEEEQPTGTNKKAKKKLLNEPLWRTYCNGKKCGYAMKRDFGPHEMKVFKVVQPISMGAGVLPDDEIAVSELGELMYMRARFERVVGSKDSEAFYMMNPDCSGGPELSVYLIRV